MINSVCMNTVGDPATLNTILHSTTWKKLRTLSEKKARHESHLEFVKASLQHHVTPRGLRIKTNLQVTDATSHFSTQWKKVVEGTQIQLLKLLKNHHKDRCSNLQQEISQLEHTARVERTAVG